MNNPIISGYGPITKEMVERVLVDMKIRFSAFFIDWVIGSETDMGKPLKYRMLIYFSDCFNYTSALAALLSFKMDRNNNIVTINQDPPEFFPKGVIAFAEDGGGDYICFDYRADPTTDDPPVVYWAHEFADVNDGLVPLAPNFEAFLGMLMSEEEAEAALAKANGKA